MKFLSVAINAGVEGSIVLANVKESKDTAFGYNAASDEYEDLIKAGVIDRTKVTRTALQNAASIAVLLLTTEWRRGREEGRQACAADGWWWRWWWHGRDVLIRPMADQYPEREGGLDPEDWIEAVFTLIS